jgi:hypothetical protein
VLLLTLKDKKEKEKKDEKEKRSGNLYGGNDDGMRRDDVRKGYYTDTDPKTDTVYFGACNSDRTAGNDTGGNEYSGRNTDSAADGRLAGNCNGCTD